ncbi:MAG TPA: glycosyl hydrolase [Elusimicrobia bacterium]|nr:glycosyl hydrolase [Elusimicrobiota bacterium]
MKLIGALFIAFIYCAPPLAAGEAETELRVAALLSRMTIEEKFGQLQQLEGEANGDVRPEFLALAKKGLLGSTLNVRGAARVNELQKAALSSRLKIPILFAFDVIHGYRTIFPVPLGETASWDTGLAREAASVAAAESRAAGVRWTFSPMMDIARDPRWGRIVEGSGEDTWLGTAMARARVRGYQGTDYSAPGKIAACAKHWAAYGAAEGGRDYNSTDVSERTLREIYFPPFKAAVEEGVATFMSSFNDLNGFPATASRWLQNDILRGEWGFDGFVVSDYAAVDELKNHGIAATGAQAAAKALSAGVDMEMASRLYNSEGPRLLKEKRISPAQLDEAVRRVLRVKFRAGIFDSPMADEREEAAVLLAPAHLKAARAAAARTFVLLKNDGILPLSKKTSSMAVVGALADDKEAPTGSWSADRRTQDTVTLLSGLRERSGDAVSISYSSAGGPTDGSTDFSAALEAAKAADVVIAVVGETWDMSGEAASRSTLALPGNQLALLKALHAAGKPVIAVLMNGRPLEIGWLAENLSAVLETWYPGTMAGPAVSDVLFGDASPGGKLPFSWPRVTGQIPVYYNHRNTGRPSDPERKYTSRYLDLPTSPQFPFGYGLSYSSFTLTAFELSASSVPANGTLTASATLENVSARAGDEVVQLYIRRQAASVTRPVRELRGFTRLTLLPGEKRRIKFDLGPKELGFLDESLRFAAEPGEVTVWIATSSVGGLSGTLHVTE